jgi:hypothetical protein
LAGIYFALQRKYVGMIAACGLACYCHNTGAAYVVGIFILAFIVEKYKARKLVMPAIVVTLALIPQAILAWIYLGSNLTPMPDLTTLRAYFTLVMGVWTGTLNPAGSILFLFLFYLSLVIFISADIYFLVVFRKTNILLISWLVPISALLIISQVACIFIYRTIQPIIFLFMLWLGWELGNDDKLLHIRASFAAAWLSILLLGALHLNPAVRGGHLDDVAAQIRSQWRTGDILVYTTQTVALPFDYYLNDLPHAQIPYSQNFYMNSPGSQLITNTGEIRQALRAWVIWPDDVLISDAERSQLENITGTDPVYSISYLQTSTINIYLVNLGKKTK